MILWPQVVSKSDGDWMSACALMQVLPLDTRATLYDRHGQFLESADAFLVRPMIQVDRKQVPAPYFQYCLRFSLSASVHGTISIDSVAELEEFRHVVSQCLASALTQSERTKWTAEREHHRLSWSRQVAAIANMETAVQEAQDADRNASFYLTQAHALIEADGGFKNPLLKFEEVLQRLVELGRQMMNEGTSQKTVSYGV